MNNTLTVETPIMFKHTINLKDYPEFNQMSEEVIKTFLTGMFVAVFELKETEFKKVQGNFREIDKSFKQFKIEMSGNDIMFLLDESSNV